jgi:hypothetical protein
MTQVGSLAWNESIPSSINHVMSINTSCLKQRVTSLPTVVQIARETMPSALFFLRCSHTKACISLVLHLRLYLHGGDTLHCRTWIFGAGPGCHYTGHTRHTSSTIDLLEPRLIQVRVHPYSIATPWKRRYKSALVCICQGYHLVPRNLWA